MVASLLRLRLLGLGNRLVRPRRRAEQITSLVALAAVLGSLVVIVLLGEFAATTTAELRRASLIAIGSLVVAAFWLIPFVVRTTGGLEPRAFAAFPIAPRRLAAGLSLAALPSIPVVLLVLLLLTTAVAWASAGPGIVLVALGSGLLTIAIAVLGSLVAAGLSGDRLAVRNTSGAIAVLLLAVLTPVLAFVDWSALGFTYLRRLAEVLAWTPLGAAWAVPGDLMLGRPGEAWLRLLIAAATIAILWLGWAALVRRDLVLPGRRTVGRGVSRLGAFGLMPDTPGGAIAARSITYWLRDARYAVPLLILPIIPVGLVLALWLAGIPWSIIVWLPVPIVSLLIGWSVHNDVAADGTAFWLHVVTSVRGRADRWGRVIVPLVIGLVVAIGGGILSAALYGDTDLALPLVSLSCCAVSAGLGVSSVASAVAPYPTVHPGDGPFQQPQGSGGAGLRQAASVLLAALLCAPPAVAIASASISGSGDFTVATVLGFVIGIVGLVGGVELGAVAMHRRAPELLTFTQQN